MVFGKRIKDQFLKRTKLCKFFFGPGCTRGSDCMFAHTHEELEQKPDLYKTTLCRDWEMGTCTLGDSCRHAHGDKELRKLPADSCEDVNSCEELHDLPGEQDEGSSEVETNRVDSSVSSTESSEDDHYLNRRQTAPPPPITEEFLRMSRRAPKRRITAPANLASVFNIRKGSASSVSTNDISDNCVDTDRSLPADGVLDDLCMEYMDQETFFAQNMPKEEYKAESEDLYNEYVPQEEYKAEDEDLYNEYRYVAQEERRAEPALSKPEKRAFKKRTKKTAEYFATNFSVEEDYYVQVEPPVQHITEPQSWVQRPSPAFGATWAAGNSSNQVQLATPSTQSVTESQTPGLAQRLSPAFGVAWAAGNSSNQVQFATPSIQSVSAESQTPVPNVHNQGEQPCNMQVPSFIPAMYSYPAHPNATTTVGGFQDFETECKAEVDSKTIEPSAQDPVWVAGNSLNQGQLFIPVKVVNCVILAPMENKTPVQNVHRQQGYPGNMQEQSFPSASYMPHGGQHGSTDCMSSHQSSGFMYYAQGQ